jgi:hypothetical protein
MTTKNQGGDRERQLLSVSFAVLVLLFGAWLFFLTEPDIRGQVTYNTTSLVNTTVNITNAAPLVYLAVLDTPVNLVAYNNKTVYCNVTVFDFDNDSVVVNATIYINGTTNTSSPDDGNNHYSNTSCARKTPQDRLMNYTCTFTVRYYANNNTKWMCNATARDVKNATGVNISNLGTINPLVAIKMPELLDYGQLEVNQISNDTLANVTNAGNRDANISVKGYGATEGDGFAFICSFGTIDLSYERYNITYNSSYTLMSQLTSASTMISRFYVPQRTSESADSINLTMWRLQVPVGAGGVCNGKILFTASDRGN